MLKPTGPILDISNVKLILCDYDDTACIHIHLGKSRPTHAEYLLACSQMLDNYYTDICPCLPNQSLKWFLETYLNEVDTRILTWSSESGLINARYVFLRKYYGERFSVIHAASSREEKLDVASDICDMFEIPRNEALLIEDHPHTINEFNNAGFLTMATAEIHTMYLEHLMNVNECVTRC